MAEFTPIESQEEFDNRISERLNRQKEALTKQYADYEDLKTKVSDYETQIGKLTKDAEEKAKAYAETDAKLAEYETKIKGYESASLKTRVAHDIGLPYELASRLTGDTEEDIRKDAENLAQLVKKNQPAAPLANPEAKPVDSIRASSREMLNQLKGE